MLVRYLDDRNSILRRTKNMYSDNSVYLEMEKQLISLRFQRIKLEKNIDFYINMINHNELYTACNKDWYITLFDDGTIDSFISSSDERAKQEYDLELGMIHECLENNKLKKLVIKSKI